MASTAKDKEMLQISLCQGYICDFNVKKIKRPVVFIQKHAAHD